jgi:uncharacterized protein (DUF1330 family)
MDITRLPNLDEAQPKEMSDEPVIVLNLLKFKSEDSLNSYFDYATNFFRTFGSRGAEVIYCGKLMEKVQGNAGDWDVVILVRYTNRKMFYDMLRSDEYLSFSHLRENAIPLWKMPYFSLLKLSCHIERRLLNLKVAIGSANYKKGLVLSPFMAHKRPNLG